MDSSIYSIFPSLLTYLSPPHSFRVRFPLYWFPSRSFRLRLPPYWFPSRSFRLRFPCLFLFVSISFFSIEIFFFFFLFFSFLERLTESTLPSINTVGFLEGSFTIDLCYRLQCDNDKGSPATPATLERSLPLPRHLVRTVSRMCTYGMNVRMCY